MGVNAGYVYGHFVELLLNVHSISAVGRHSGKSGVQWARNPQKYTHLAGSKSDHLQDFTVISGEMLKTPCCITKLHPGK